MEVEMDRGERKMGVNREEKIEKWGGKRHNDRDR